MFKTILRFIVKFVDLKGLLKSFIKEVLHDALMKAVKKSATTVDDRFVPDIYKAIEKDLFRQIDTKLDLNKLLKL